MFSQFSFLALFKIIVTSRNPIPSQILNSSAVITQFAKRHVLNLCKQVSQSTRRCRRINTCMLRLHLWVAFPECRARNFFWDAQYLQSNFGRLGVVNQCATANPDGRKRALVVGGGIANFTDVAATFNGIIRALREKVCCLLNRL